MDDTIQYIHNVSMELFDKAKMEKMRGGDEEKINNYMKDAYDFALLAANKLTKLENDNDILWKASLLRSAGWLAVKCGHYRQALRLAELGLSFPTNSYETARLKELKLTVVEKLKQEDSVQKDVSISGILASADLINNQINIKDDTSGEITSFKVSEGQITQSIRYLLGDVVEIEYQKNEKGVSILKDIRLAA